MTENSDDPEDEESAEIADADDFIVDSDQREEDRARVTFEECRQIKHAGDHYRRTGSLDAVADELGLSRSDAEELVARYILLVTEPEESPIDITVGAMRAGTLFYGGERSLSRVAELMEYDEETARDRIREFVGGSLRERDLDAVDMDQVPSDLYVYLFGEGLDFDAYRPPQEFLADVQSVKAQYRATLQSIGDVQQALRHAVQPYQGIDWSALQATQSLNSVNVLGQIQDDIQRVQASLSLLNSFTPITSLLDAYREAIKRAIETGISNFDPPEAYDPDAVVVNEMAKMIGVRFVENLITEIEEKEDEVDGIEALTPYIEPVREAIEDYEDGRYYLPIFVFISFQDGLLAALCDYEGASTNEDGYYDWKKKRNVFAARFDEMFGVETGVVAQEWTDFYEHRNAIMHGDPIASFDENIATIALLFLILILDTVLDEHREAADEE